MSDLIHRAQQAKARVADPGLPKWQRLVQGLSAFSGLELEPLAPGIARQLESDLAEVNEVLAPYQLQEWDDHQRVSNADLQDLLDMVDAAASHAIDAEVERIVDELDGVQDKLPETAIAETREHRDLMIPRLIRVLRDTISDARAGVVQDGNAHFFAVFLLPELRAAESLPVILEAFTLLDGLSDELFGDAIMSTLARILAEFAHDQLEVIDALVRNTQLQEFARWEAANTYVLLVRDGRLTREEAVARLGRLLRATVAEERDEYTVISGLISVLVSLSPREAIDDIKEAFARDLVDTSIVDYEGVEQSLAEGEEHVRDSLAHCRASGVKDTIEELRRWAVFQERPPQRPATPTPPPAPAPAPRFPVEPVEPEAVRVVSHGPHIGRNDPCPCGSGKKFKKCCLRREERSQLAGQDHEET